ncbi:MAG: M23 family metallopeptidase [Eubacteriales bacterium]|nr:M23 family metallopeptidase [Eubacteriales bacterium]
MKNNYSVKANRILYISIISVLCLTALIVGIVASVSRSKQNQPIEPPSVTEEPIISDGIIPDDSQPAISDPSPSESEEKPDPSTILPTFISPAKGVVSTPHETERMVFSPSMNDYRTHAGIDITSSVGAEVYAAADGKITKIWTDEFMGKCISISHNGDAVTVYKNLCNDLPDGIAEGVSVKAGQVIAGVGETASSESAEEPHLHFELLIKNSQTNPLSHISDESKTASLTYDESYEG